MNVPNMLTICRFLLIPVYIVVFSYGHIISAFLIVVLAGLTDVLDGYIARSRGLVTPLGEMLDPLADKCMMIVVILSLLITGLIPWYAAAAFFIRDIGMIIGSAIFHFRGKKTVPANTMGKITTVLYYIAILLIVFQIDYAIPYLWFVIAFSFITSAIYIVKFKSLNRTNVRS
jgi:cardiolipin synthase